MDPVGISIGIPGLIALLIGTALRGYKIFETAQALGEDFTELQRQFRVQGERLKDWAYVTNQQANGLDSENTIADFLKQHPEKLELVAGTLARVAKVFADMQQMESAYGILIIEPENLIESSSDQNKTSRFRRMKEKTRKVFFRPKDVTSPDPVIPSPNIVSVLQENLPLIELEKRAAEFSRSVSLCERLQWALCDKDRLRELITGLKRCNQDLRNLTSRYFTSTAQLPSKSADRVSSELHFMVPFPKNEDYVGESQVRTFFEQKRGTQDPLISRVSVALHGLGGVGKTQDVLDFVYSCKKSHHVFWIYCESPTRFDEDYRKLAKLVKIPGYDESDPSQDIRGIVRNWLESGESGDWIVVFDNADKKTDFFPGSTGGESHGLAKFIPKCAKGTLVITTRDYEVAQQLAGLRGVLTKEAMVPTDAQALFQKHYPSGAPYNDADCGKLLHELQYLPLAITQVASYLEMNRQLITPTQYLAKFQKTKADQQQLLSKPVYNPFRQDLSESSVGSAETVLTTFEITFRQIQKQSPLAGSILRLMACVGAQGIPHELLVGLESQSDEILLGEALAKLRNFSLLQHQESNIGRTYTLHSLVHLAIQYFISPEEKASAIEDTARVISNVIPPDGAFKHWPRWREYLPHARAFLSYVGNELDNVHIATICFSMAEYLGKTGRYRDSRDLAERSTTIRQRLLGYEHPETLKSMLRLADRFFNIGMRDKCEELEVKVIALSKQVLGENHPDTLKAMGSFANTLLLKGKMDEAENIQRKIIETHKVVLGEDHPDALKAVGSLATTLFQRGRLDEAEIIQRKVLETCEGVLGKDHPDTLEAMKNVAVMLRRRRRFDDAEVMERKIMEILKVVTGENHPDTLTVMGNLSFTLWYKGRLKEAESLQHMVLEHCRVLIGEDHPDTLAAMGNLAFLLREDGKLDEAETLGRKALEMRTVILGQDHPDTLAAMGDLAFLLQENGKFDQAETLRRKVLVTSTVVLGQDHPDTLDAMEDLSLALSSRGILDEAETLQRKVLDVRKSTLGEDHPDTLKTMYHLSLALPSKEGFNEVEKLQRKVMEASKIVLGEDHPDTLVAMDSLAFTLQNEERSDEAETLQRQVLHFRNVVLGEDHPDTLKAMYHLSLTLSSKGILDEAETLRRKVLEVRKVVLGEDHPDTLKAMFNLSLVLTSRERFDEAESVLRKILEVRRVELGEDHPNTIEAMFYLSLVLPSEGTSNEAESVLRKILEVRRVELGEDHPDTLKAMFYLSLTLSSRGILDEAEILLRKVLEARRVELGEDHPDTLDAMEHLSLALSSRGILDEAEKLQRKVLDVRKSALGEDHPDTLKAMYHLSLALPSNEGFEEVEKLQRKVMETSKIVLGEDHPDTLTAMDAIAHTCHSKSSLDVAIEMMEEVVSRRLRILGSEDEKTKSSMEALNEWKAEAEG